MRTRISFYDNEYIGVASAVWRIRNPTANEIQNIIYIKSVLTFSKEDKFQ